MIENIEIGALITSRQKCNQVLDIFKELKHTKTFVIVE
jgi:hypothetical protein